MDDLLTSALKKVLKRKVLGRLERLTEDEVNSWRSGVWEIADDVIDRYNEKLLDHREAALRGIRSITPQFVSDELVRLKPEFERYWKDEVFFTRLSEETEKITRFLKKENT